MALPLTAVLTGAYVYGLGGRYVSTENAYVRADVIAISSEIDGRVARVLVDDNAYVEAGQLLFEIDPKPFALKLAAAESELAIVRQQIESKRAQYKESELDIDIAKERIRYLDLEFKRWSGLSSQGHSAKSRLESAEHDLITARQKIRSLEQRKLMVVADLGGRPDLPAEEHPNYMRAVVKRDQAALDLERTKIRAPAAGYVGKMTLEAGEQVDARETT
ncbi:MAG: HlyD family secretion protein, partial [Hyphomicrobiaceae bacterium]